jgi:ADP-ribose pyrophosphatase YjhB (NUDIX family)
MKFCSRCGHRVRLAIPEGDTLPRYLCDDCGQVFYSNPKVIVGTLPVWGEKILLCRRSIEPRKGCWTLPSGFLEDGETLAEGARRETVEETGVDVTLGPLFSVFDIPHINQVYLLYRAGLTGPEHPESTPESAAIRLFPAGDLPWAELAFRAVEFALRRYTGGESLGMARVHLGSYIRGEQDPWILQDGS